MENDTEAKNIGTSDEKRSDKPSGKSDTSPDSRAVSESDSGKDTASDADTGASPGIWIAGIGLLLLCVAAGAGIMKLIRDYKG